MQELPKPNVIICRNKKRKEMKYPSSALSCGIIFSLLVLVVFTLDSCNSSDPEWADPEAHEKTEQLNKQYGKIIIGTWYYEHIGEKHHFTEELTFHEGGILTGNRRWQTRSLVTIDGKQRYTDWEDLEEMCGTFTGKWRLAYWNGTGAEKHNSLILEATFDNKEKHVSNAYQNDLVFGYAKEQTLSINGAFFNDENGWANYQRRNATQ